MSENPDSFSFIPEIEDEIFEWAARMELRSAPSLTVISRRVQKRVEVIIYETIKLSAFGTFANNRGTSFYERFQHTLHARPAEFFAQHVRNLCITGAVPRRVASEVLAKCTGVRNLVSWQYEELPKYLPFMLILPFASTLTSLSTHKVTVRMLAESGTVFPRVTQLTVGLNSRIRFPTLEWLPNLTSIEIDFSDQPAEDEEWAAEVSTVLSTVPLLRSLVVMANTDYAISRAKDLVLKQDSRIVVVNTLEHVERWFADFYS